MTSTREINRLLATLLLLFGIVAAAAAYWAIIGPETIYNRQDNPRLIQQEASIQRGAIIDRNGIVLAESRLEGDTRVRVYPHPAAYSAVGYYSLRYGTGGVEAAYNTILRGDDQPRDLLTTLAERLMHETRAGRDIRLTLDLTIQQQLFEAMRGHRGAAVVLDVPSGEVLALVSLPTFDPNTLDEHWDELRADEGNPFFNRALQGNYQPGGVLQTPLLAAALLMRVSPDSPIADASAPLELNGLEMTCAVPLPPLDLTLREAYAFACPRAFETLVRQLGGAVVYDTFNQFAVDRRPALLGTFDLSPTPTPPAVPQYITPEEIFANALGQGTLTTTPLKMAMMAAAVVNDGNAPQPVLVDAVHRPNDSEWTPLRSVRPTLPYMTASTARQIQDLMRSAVAGGAAQNAGRPNIDIGGHASLAYSGDETHSWFVGFATLGGLKGVAVAVVLENTADTGLAADIGGTALLAARDTLAAAP